jgi:hypothetical protein
MTAAGVLDVVLALTVLEAVALVLLHRRTGRGLAPADLLPTLLAGASLLVALRLALGGASFMWIAVCLLAALLAHLVDLWRRRE